MAAVKGFVKYRAVVCATAASLHPHVADKDMDEMFWFGRGEFERLMTTAADINLRVLNDWNTRWDDHMRPSGTRYDETQSHAIHVQEIFTEVFPKLSLPDWFQQKYKPHLHTR